jgi:aromatic-L-amino-acid decarboxylase
MSPDEFRRLGRQLVDWLAEYYEQIEDYPVLSPASPGDLRAQLPGQAPRVGEPFEDILRDFESLVLPGITHWQSPAFYAYFPANASGPSILGELLSAGLGVQGMKWSTSPACTELEMHVMDWLVDMLALPSQFSWESGGGGVIQDTASTATLCALVAARERKTEGASNSDGVRLPLVAYASAEAHVSVEKGAGIAGIGRNFLRRIPTDGHHRLDPSALRRTVLQDLDSGLQPFFVCATVGTTAVGAIDPVSAIADVASEFGLWLHVDAAMYGTAAVCPEFRDLHRGIERADSYCFNPHKWMFTNFDCDCFFVARRAELERALSLTPEYLRDTAVDPGQVTDYRNWQVPLGRRFRALKLWFVIRYYGVQGIRHHVREHIRLAEELESSIAAHPDFELAPGRSLNLVCFRHKRGDRFTQILMETLNKAGRVFLTHAIVDDRFVIRACVGQARTEQRHVAALWKLVCEAARTLEAGEAATSGRERLEDGNCKGKTP